MTDINTNMNVNQTGGISGAGNNGSIQFVYAMLQMELAKTQKDNAMSYIEDIKKDQKSASQLADMINRARTFLEIDRNPSSRKDSVEVHLNKWKQLSEECKQVGIDSSMLYNPDGSDKSKTRLETLIESLKSKQEQAGSTIQQQMVMVNDYIGQYNAYSQGSSSAVSQANQTLSSLARGQ